MSERKLNKYRRQFAELKRQVENIGFICDGTVSKRFMKCGNLGCQCHKDKTKRHGPYYQLTKKRSGKTVSSYLSEDEAELYSQWINHNHELKKIFRNMMSLSEKSMKQILKNKKKYLEMELVKRNI